MFKILKALAPQTDNTAREACEAILGTWDEEPGQWMTQTAATPSESLQWVQTER